MKNVSNEFKKIIKQGGPFYAYANIVLSDGTELELDADNDFFASGNSFSESAGDGFPLGAAISKTISLSIDNSDGRFSNYDFYYARITLFTEAILSTGLKERIKEGTFTVIDPVSPGTGDVIELTAANDMYKTDKTFTGAVVYPTTALGLLQSVCNDCGIILGSVSFTNSSFQISSAPPESTCRQIIGYIAQIAGGNALCDENNHLVIKTYSFPIFEQVGIINGGIRGDELTDQINGGTFGDGLSRENYISGGVFGEGQDYVLLSDFSSDPEIATDDIVITGVETTGEVDDEDTTFFYGEEGYVISIDNPLISENEQSALKAIGDIIIGIRIRPFLGEFSPNPCAEFMDPVYLVSKNNTVYESFVANHDFTYLGNSSISNDSDPPAGNNAQYYSEATAAYRKARQELKQQKTEFEKAIDDLNTRLDNASGLYMTAEKQSDGSSIYFFHDKPTLEESMVIWEMTADAFAVSSDGGKTWNAGLTVDGVLIAKILNTIGINADWIRTGTLKSSNFEEGVSGMSFNLNSGEINGYYTSSSGSYHEELHINGSYISVKRIASGREVETSISPLSIKVIEPEGNVTIGSIFEGYQEISLNDTKRGLRLQIGPDNIYYSDGDTDYTAKSGRAEFSDGSYLEFRRGFLVGGKTASGEEI